MAFLDMFDKVDDIVYKPIETICSWLTCPLKKIEHNQEMERERLKHELAQMDKEHEAKLALDMKKAEIELEEMRKDKAFEHNKEIFETIKKYQMDMAKVSVEIGNTIGNMTIELRQKANNFVLGNVERYKELQDDAIVKAEERLKQIEAKFPAESKAKDIMIKAVEKQVISIIDRADNFINNLNEDLKNITGLIDDITRNANKSVENRLSAGISDMPALDGNDNNVRYLNNK